MKTIDRPVKILKFQGDITSFGDVVNLETYKEREVEMLEPYDPNYTENFDKQETKATRKEETTFRKLRLLEQNLQLNKIGYSMDDGAYVVTKKYSEGYQTRYLHVDNGFFCFGTARKVLYSEKSIRSFIDNLIQWYNN